jgi:2-polyprenyl-3-methyl-5-hydroxy-6-metoxy-1,4-benzoquinol methylase
MNMTAKLTTFGKCEICGAQEWHAAYQGRIRDGSVGKYLEDGLVAQCGGCSVQRMIETCAIPDEYYESDQYRKSLQQSVESEKAFAEQDWATRYTHDALWPMSIRGKTIADIGCGAGSFLDSCCGQAAKLIAVEPCVPFQPSLRERGYHMFGSTRGAAAAFPALADLIVSISVIEHVSDPVGFLRDMRPLLKRDGTLLITTPNRDNILGSLIPERFLEFFYRSAHRWYFDSDSLAGCAKRAGYRVVKTASLQKYGMSNMLQWLRDGKPMGFVTLPVIGPVADGFWKGYLEEVGRADTLCMKLQLHDSN